MDLHVLVKIVEMYIITITTLAHVFRIMFNLIILPAKLALRILQEMETPVFVMIQMPNIHRIQITVHVWLGLSN